MGLLDFGVGLAAGALGGIAYQKQKDEDLIAKDVVTEIVVTDPNTLTEVADLRAALLLANRNIADLQAVHTQDQDRITTLSDALQRATASASTTALAARFEAKVDVVVPGVSTDLPTTGTAVLLRDSGRHRFCGQLQSAPANWYVSVASGGYKRLKLLQPGSVNCGPCKFVDFVHVLSASDSPICPRLWLTGRVVLNGSALGFGEALPRLFFGNHHGSDVWSTSTKLALNNSYCPQLDESGMKVVEKGHHSILLGRALAADTIELLAIPEDHSASAFESPRTKFHAWQWRCQAVDATIDGMTIDAVSEPRADMLHLQANGKGNKRSWWTADYDAASTTGDKASYIVSSKWPQRSQYGAPQSYWQVKGMVNTPTVA